MKRESGWRNQFMFRVSKERMAIFINKGSYLPSFKKTGVANNNYD